jgi:hypothetical protein
VRSWGFPRLGSFHGRETRPDELRKWSTFSREGCPEGGVSRSPQISAAPHTSHTFNSPLPHFQLPAPRSPLPSLPYSYLNRATPSYEYRDRRSTEFDLSCQRSIPIATSGVSIKAISAGIKGIHTERVFKYTPQVATTMTIAPA